MGRCREIQSRFKVNNLAVVSQVVLERAEEPNAMGCHPNLGTYIPNLTRGPHRSPQRLYCLQGGRYGAFSRPSARGSRPSATKSRADLPLSSQVYKSQFIEREGRPEAAPILDWIEYWYGQLPPAKQPDIRGRLRSDDINQFTSAYFELQMFAMLQKMEFEVTVEPALAAGRYIPDFLAQRGDERFYLEATVCGQDAGDLRITRNEEDAVEKIRSALEDAGVDVHSHLWLQAEGGLNHTLSKKKVAKPFIDLLRRTTATEVQESHESNPYGHQYQTGLIYLT